MGKAHSDLELELATQVAYLNMDEGDNVGDTVNYLISKYSGKENLSSEEQAQLSTAQNILQITSQAEGNGASEVDWRSWTVVSTCNDENDSGYYGCLIDTGDGSAIIGNRGSESFDTSQTVKDWVDADLGLLDSGLTKQQGVAGDYAQEIWEKYGDQYDSFEITGHSLGGNLAQHQGVVMSQEMGDKLIRAVSYDGPGFSQEYIEAHRELIDQASGKLTRYQWSWVSSLLTGLPGEDCKIIKADNQLTDGDGIGDYINNMLDGQLWRHATTNVVFDENGNVIEGDESDLSKVTGPISRLLDDLEKGDMAKDVIAEIDRVAQIMETGSLIEKISVILQYSKVIVAVVVVVAVAAVYQYAMEAISKFKETVTYIKEKITDLYYNYIAPSVASHYKIVTARLSSSQNSINTAISRISTLNDQMYDIKKNMQYYGADGAYYKSCMATYYYGMNSDIKKLKNLMSLTTDAINRYSNAESQIEEMFA